MHGVELVVLIGVTVLIGGIRGKRLGVAPPLVMLLVGTGLGFVPGLGEIELPSEVVLVLFLPALFCSMSR